jgi:hypothetical protein
MKRPREGDAAGSGAGGGAPSSSSSSSSSTPVSLVALELQAAVEELSIPAKTYEHKGIRDALFAVRAALMAIPEREVRPASYFASRFPRPGLARAHMARRVRPWCLVPRVAA